MTTTLDADTWRARPGGPSDAGIVAALALERARTPLPLLVGVTGAVAAGKSTFAALLADALSPHLRPVAVVSTDGFLRPNAEIDRRGLTHRKGFPETYDAALLQTFLAAAGAGDPRAAAPVYSHLTYDVVPGERVAVDGAPAVVVEGLHLGHDRLGARPHLDLLVHLEADDADLERWFLQRFRALVRAAAAEPTAFLHGVSHRPLRELEAAALGVWRAVNVPNLTEHIRPARAAADVVLHLGPDHRAERVDLGDCGARGD
jgi:type I pantothenate kinase